MPIATPCVDISLRSTSNPMAMGAKVLIPVLLYLFHRIDQRLDGKPTLVVIDEAWIMLANELFGAKIEEWLRTLRKKKRRRDSRDSKSHRGCKLSVLRRDP